MSGGHNLAFSGPETPDKSPQHVSLEETLGDILFPSISSENLRMGEVTPEAPRAASTNNSDREPRRVEAKAAAEEEMPSVPETPFHGLLRSGANSGLGPGVQGRVLNHPSASNSSLLGWWLLRVTLVDSGDRHKATLADWSQRLPAGGSYLGSRHRGLPHLCSLLTGPSGPWCQNSGCACACVRVRDLGCFLFVRLVSFYWGPLQVL